MPSFKIKRTLERAPGALECGGKRSATPPSEGIAGGDRRGLRIGVVRRTRVAKAVSRSACHRTPRYLLRLSRMFPTVP